MLFSYQLRVSHHWLVSYIKVGYFTWHFTELGYKHFTCSKYICLLERQCLILYHSDYSSFNSTVAGKLGASNFATVELSSFSGAETTIAFLPETTFEWGCCRSHIHGSRELHPRTVCIYYRYGAHTLALMRSTVKKKPAADQAEVSKSSAYFLSIYNQQLQLSASLWFMV